MQTGNLEVPSPGDQSLPSIFPEKEIVVNAHPLVLRRPLLVQLQPGHQAGAVLGRGAG